MTDWNPLDPDAANVFYDLSSWSSDQQAELTALLANADIAHAWVESELVVSEEFEDVVDRIFERLEKELGIGSTAVVGGVDDGDEVTEYELDDYSMAERREITERLVAARITHRWVEDTLVVPTAAEDMVEDILDEYDDVELDDSV
ncbi:MAG: hypothetical protein FGM45_01860 [Actinobacteria bacterium]|nr:hypothetical protein [Actinomycetota bacterium]